MPRLTRPTRRSTGPLTPAALLCLFAALPGAPGWAGAQATPPTGPPPPAPVAPAEPAPAPATATATAEDDGLDQQGVTWALQIEVPDELRALVERYTDLARYQRSERQETITRGELTRLLAAAPGQVRKLLETEGYFDARVHAELPAAPTGPSPLSTPVQVRLVVQPGPRTQVGTVRLEVGGELALAAERGDAQARAQIEALQRSWSLPPGQPFTRDAWDDAKTAILTQLRTEAYAGAAWSHSAARVDAEQHSAVLTLLVDSGPLFRFGSVNVEGLDHVRLDAVLALRNFAGGDPLREQALLNFQDRLVRTGLFDTVSVTYEPDPEQAGATPIVVRLRERLLQQATVGVGVSDLSGPRITLEHLHQRVFNLGWQAKTKLQLGRSARSLSLDLTSHPQPGPYRNLIAGAVSETEASGLRVTSERLRFGRTQDTERIERTYYIELERAFTRDLSLGSITDDTSAASYHYQWVWRRLDHPILPTRGWGISADGAVGHSFATTQRSGWFGRATARVTTYWTPGDNWYGQSRFEAGNVLAPSGVAVPYTLLFRAGGDESVRGYSYQGLGPTDASGSAVGGRVLATGSVELARPFSPRHPAWWGAVFVDAGNAASDWPSWQAEWGYGVGLRWRSPVGPLRIDIAYGQALQRLRLHFTVGITF